MPSLSATVDMRCPPFRYAAPRFPSALLLSPPLPYSTDYANYANESPLLSAFTSAWLKGAMHASIHSITTTRGGRPSASGANQLPSLNGSQLPPLAPSVLGKRVYYTVGLGE
jgi:hypothetical protein